MMEERISLAKTVKQAVGAQRRVLALDKELAAGHAAYAELRQRVADASARAARAEQEAGQLRAAAGGAHEEVAEEAQRRAAEWLAYELGRSG